MSWECVVAVEGSLVFTLFCAGKGGEKSVGMRLSSELSKFEMVSFWDFSRC